MSQQFQFWDIVFLGIVVLLLVNRLRSVLGTRPSADKSAGDRTVQSAKVVDISEYRTVESPNGSKLEQDIAASTGFDEDSEIVQNLKKIKESFPSFDLVDFMQKAPRAFEYIAVAFSKGDKDSLKPLLNDNIYRSFEKAIDERNERNETAEFSLIGFKSIKLTDAKMSGNDVELTVEFETEQTNIVKNSAGEVVAGDPTYIETVTDIWTLKKNMRSSDPVWVLTATHSK